MQAAYNGERVFVRYRWPVSRPGLLHDVVVYEGGKWVRKGNAVPGSEPDGLHEDRVAMMLDDGGVPEFARYGGYVTVGTGIANFTSEAGHDAVKEHAYLGKKLKQEEVSKSLPDTRSNIAGTNWDGERKQPRLMFDAATAGYKALKWADVAAGRVNQDAAYALIEGQAVPFDANVGWAEGDTLPRRFLRTPDGSKADIAVQGRGRWADGHWDVTLHRAMDTGHPLDDKILPRCG